MTSSFERSMISVLRRLVKKGLEKVFGGKSKDIEIEKTPPTPDESEKNTGKNHPWRMCPIGQHWVQTHPLTVPASDSGPERETIRRGHCRTNPGKSEIYTADELKEIAERYFNEILDDKDAMPVPDSLGFPAGNKYDRFIGGWTKFWNEVLKSDSPLKPDFVKALIATESSFRLHRDMRSNDGPARGLIQVTESTRKILQNPKGELWDHHIEMTAEESRDPTVNIAAGIRWLHHKKRLAERRLKREITWEEAGAEYKGIYQQIGKNEKADEIMRELRRYHRRLKDQRK